MRTYYTWDEMARFCRSNFMIYAQMISMAQLRETFIMSNFEYITNYTLGDILSSDLIFKPSTPDTTIPFIGKYQDFIEKNSIIVKRFARPHIRKLSNIVNHGTTLDRFPNNDLFIIETPINFTLSNGTNIPSRSSIIVRKTDMIFVEGGDLQLMAQS